jgi:hypothetical protein
MRIVLPALAIASVLAPLPALAADDDAARIAGELNDPARQEQMAAAIEAMMGALLEMPAAPLINAAKTMAGEPTGDVDPDQTIGDLMGPDATEAPREFAHRLPQMMGAMATLATTMEAMLPELRAMGERMAEDMARESTGS